MEEKSWLRRHWKLVLNLITLAALIILIFAIRDQLGDTFRNLARVNGWALLLLIPIEFLNYHAQSRLYQHLFGIVGNKLGYWHLFRASLELNFVNHVFPSGGVTGLSYFTLRLREGSKLSSGKATLIHVMKIMLVFLSFEILVVFGLICLSVMGSISNITLVVASCVSTLLVVGTGVFAYIVGSQSRINHFFTSLTKVLNRLIQLVRPKHPETINVDQAKQMFDDFHHSYKEIKSNWQRLKAPFWYALLANITEVAAVYVVYIAFDQFVNVGAVIMAYAVANFAGLVSVLPGGVGIYEALMTAVLASAGIPLSVSLPVTVMYRVLNTLIQIPPGFYLYNRALQKNQLAADLSHE